jgi:hypothetical protein
MTDKERVEMLKEENKMLREQIELLKQINELQRKTETRTYPRDYYYEPCSKPGTYIYSPYVKTECATC